MSGFNEFIDMERGLRVRGDPGHEEEARVIYDQLHTPGAEVPVIPMGVTIDFVPTRDRCPITATLTADLAARFFPYLSLAAAPNAWTFNPEIGVTGAWECGGVSVDDRLFSDLRGRVAP